MTYSEQRGLQVVGHEAAIPWDAVLAAGHEERRLREPGVRRVIEPLLSGGDAKYTPRDFEYVRDLGLVAPDAPLRIANPVYAELLPRELTWVLKHEMSQQTAW